MRPPLAAELIRAALDEDVGEADWTTLWTVSEHAEANGRIIARVEGVVAGLDVAAEVFRHLDLRATFTPRAQDGDPVRVGAVVATLQGPARALLSGERTALNFLQRLSGVATMTRRFVDAVAGTHAAIVDTRKTTPGWRLLEKAAVRAGGGSNHRFGLHDMVLVKDNHIAVAGGITAALAAVRARNERGLQVEVEVRSVEELDEALAAYPDRILLDNMALPQLQEAVEHARRSAPPRPLLEASGNMTLERVRAVAETGVDLISVGAITHSAPALDLSLLLEIA
jgi:nicotinate-nucleotide pyrophosphorylase (carboxylating)